MLEFSSSSGRKNTRGGGEYRAQEGVHELVHFCGTHQVLALENPHRQSRDDGQVLSQRIADDLAIALIVLDSLDLSDPAESLKSLVVELVDVGHVRIRDHDIGQRLHITETVRNPVFPYWFSCDGFD